MSTEKEFYVYTHKREDNKNIFYVGIGHTLVKGENNKDRAYTISGRRNKIWKQIYYECGKKIVIEKIFFSNNISECSIVEMKLIELYGRIDLNTGTLANMTKGGEYSNAYRIVQYDKKGFFLKEWPNYYEPSKYYNVSFKAIFNAVTLHNCCKDYQWRKIMFNENINNISAFVNNRIRTIYQYDLKGNYLNRFNSTKEASHITNIDRGSINNCALKKRKSAGGYLWSYDKF